MINYIKLRFKEKKYNYKFHKVILVKDIIKYILYFLILFQNILALMLQSTIDFQSNPYIKEFILSGKLVLLIILSSLLLSHFSIRITVPLPLEPFWRFESKNKWYLKSFLYPLIRSTLFIVLLIFTVNFGIKGLFYFLLFYLVYLLSTKLAQNRLLFFIYVVAIYLSKINEKEIFTIMSLMLILTITIERIKLNYFITKRQKEFPFIKMQSNLIKKEINYFSYYSSEQVYNLVALIIYFYIIIFNIHSSKSGLYPISVFVFPALAFLPFAHTCFNLFGMDTNVVKTYFYNYDKTIDYLIKSLRIFQYFINLLNVIFLVVMIFYMKISEMSFAYILGVIAFNEFILFVSVLISISFIEKKEVKWRPGQYFLSKNINLLPIVLTVLVSIINYSYKFFNIAGLLFLVIISIYLNIYHLKSLAVKLIEKKKVKSIEYV